MGLIPWAAEYKINDLEQRSIEIPKLAPAQTKRQKIHKGT